MQHFQLNLWIVLAAAFVRFFLGWFWFAPGVFMKPWLKSIGMSESKAKKDMKKGMALGMLAHLAGSFLMAFALAHIVKFFQSADFLPEGAVSGLSAGLFTWLCFVAVVQIDSVTAEKRPFVWFLISSGYQLAGLLIMGAILALWA